MRSIWKTLQMLMFLGMYMSAKAQCPPTWANLTFVPPGPQFCIGDTIKVYFTTPGTINFLNWSYGGPANNMYTNAVDTFFIEGIQGGGPLMLDGQIVDPGFAAPCDFNMMPIDIQINPPPVANAGPDVMIGVSPNYVTIGGSPVGSGGPLPYAYNWIPNSGYVNGTSDTDPNPDVSPTGMITNYQVIVTDANGCKAFDDVNVYNANLITVNKTYAILKKELDAGYYNSVNVGATNYFYFMFDEEYYVPASTNLNYKVYNDNGNLVTTTPAIANEKLGDNRFYLNVGSLATGFYKLYVYNQKNEVWQARIKVN